MIKKIAFFCLNSGSEATSGTEIQLLLIAKKMAEKSNFKISFITAKNKNTSQLSKKISFISDINLNKNILNIFLFPFQIFKSLFKANAEIYIASAAGIEIGFIALFCQLTNRKFIFRTASSVDCTNEKINQLGPIIGSFYKYGLKHASAVITQNTADKENLLKYHKIKSTVIKNGIEIPKNKPKISQKKYILWVGSARQLKQPEIFLDLAKKNPKEKFLMIMPKSSDLNYWKTIYNQAQKIKNLTFIEKVPSDEIQKYFDQAKILVGTSKYEGFPNVYLQACLAANPIVSLNVNPDNFIFKNNLGFISDNQPKLLEKQVKELLSDSKLYLTMSSNAFEYVKNNHEINKNINQWISVINKIEK